MVTEHNFKITKTDREFIKNQKSCTMWMSGLSGSGKSTIANLLEQKLYELGHHTYILDGDNTRLGLNVDLGFSNSDRIENIRRVAEVSKLMNDAGIIVICSFISPFLLNRQQAHEIIKDSFIEIYINTSIDVCEQRDVKGLYKKARNGEIKEFTGISSPYEIPINPELTLINETLEQIDINVNTILEYLKNNRYI